MSDLNIVVTCCMSGDRVPFGLRPFGDWGCQRSKVVC
jgi:hypothetical protein